MFQLGGVVFQQSSMRISLEPGNITNEFQNQHRDSLSLISGAHQLMHQQEAGRLVTETENCGRDEGLWYIAVSACGQSAREL